MQLSTTVATTTIDLARSTNYFYNHKVMAKLPSLILHKHKALHMLRTHCAVVAAELHSNMHNTGAHWHRPNLVQTFKCVTSAQHNTQLHGALCAWRAIWCCQLMKGAAQLHDAVTKVAGAATLKFAAPAAAITSILVAFRLQMEVPTTLPHMHQEPAGPLKDGHSQHDMPATCPDPRSPKEISRTERHTCSRLAARQQAILLVFYFRIVYVRQASVVGRSSG
jgi:hypothetical protein